MNKEELIQEIAQQCGLPQKQVGEVIASTITVIEKKRRQRQKNYAGRLRYL